jgi:hypothetical protein
MARTLSVASRANEFLTRVQVDLNDPLTIAVLLGPTVRTAAIILATMDNRRMLWFGLGL